MNGRMDGWMDGWMGGWMDAWMDGWMDGWMGGWIVALQIIPQSMQPEGGLNLPFHPVYVQYKMESRER